MPLLKALLKMDSDENIRKRIWLIADGIPLKLGSMTIRTSDSGKLLVTGWTNTINFNNISKGNILQELDDLKSLFSVLANKFPDIYHIVNKNDLTIEYHMAYDDSGKAGIGLCSEIEGKLNWYID